MFNDFSKLVRDIYIGEDFIPLHRPIFLGNEKKYLENCIDTTFVSSVGEYVDLFEKMICEFTGSKYAVATMNGTAALHMSLILAGVEQDDEVITQGLTFVATANAILYEKAHPVFLDSGENNLGLGLESLRKFLENKVTYNSEKKEAYNKNTGRRIKACLPMHVFGHPVQIDEINKLCKAYNITVIEDAAEATGSFYKSRHLGTISELGVLSFNGNKTVTSGGGGCILIQDEETYKKAKHLTTTAKVAHRWNFHHDQKAYNYRMPNINAALICAQLEKISYILERKKEVTDKYREFFLSKDVDFIDKVEDSQPSFWLNAIQFKSKKMRDEFLEKTNSNGIMTRPLWDLMSELPHLNYFEKDELSNAKHYQATIVNIPSSVPQL